MAHAHPRPVAATVSGLAGCLLLAACSGSGTPTHANTSNTHRDATTAPAAAGPTGHTAGAAHPSGATQPGTATPTACSLITEKDVTTAVGADPGKGAADTQRGATVCAYGSYPKQVLTVNVLPSQGRVGYARIRRDPKLTKGAGLRVADVGGVGDQAFELSGPHVDAIYLTKGDALIVIGLSGPASPTHGAALALAKIAVGRL